ncbi:MAG: calcium/sodium antiporter [Rhodospirillales bacterium]|nr:calcium/sodium antiporter [Rhodospirillales bacterium]
MMMYIQVLAGFVLLVGAAEILVRGSVSLADRFGISPLVIGMTVVAVGTSAPELVVSLSAVFEGSSGLAIGNLVGSNTTNILLVLGSTCLLKPIVEHLGPSLLDGWVLIGGTALFIGLCLYGDLGQLAGVILLIAFFGFLAASYWRDSHDPAAIEEVAQEVEGFQGEHKPLYVALLMIVAGLVGLGYGADLLVQGGVQIARIYGVSEEVIGLTLFALGTSLPELAASLVAAFRGHPAVAIGNVIGSNLFNLLGVGGVLGLVANIPVPGQILSFDLWIMFGATAVLFPVLVLGWRVPRVTGAVLLLCYIGYVSIQAYGVENAMALLG